MCDSPGGTILSPINIAPESGSRGSVPLETQVKMTIYQLGGKRLFDLIIASAALLVLSPLIALLSAAVRIFIGSPIIFRQDRPGLHGHVFSLLKFRTMTDERDRFGTLLPDDQRLTTLGSLLRKASLDELPELVNVIRGEMSLVGPRPLLPRYLERYSRVQAHRHDVRPGMTGLAQVSGRNSLSWARKFELDVQYVQAPSLVLDLKILIRTVVRVLRRDGIGGFGRSTVDEFLGNTDAPR